jgi:uncharacterized DUF497 family protein
VRRCDSSGTPRRPAANLRKHGVSFEEAASVFGDPLARTYEDPNATGEEARELTFGVSSGGRAVVVAHCEREDRVRIISAREMTRGETGL